jgi:hypothetical protein
MAFYFRDEERLVKRKILSGERKWVEKPVQEAMPVTSAFWPAWRNLKRSNPCPKIPNVFALSADGWRIQKRILAPPCLWIKREINIFLPILIDEQGIAAKSYGVLEHYETFLTSRVRKIVGKTFWGKNWKSKGMTALIDHLMESESNR